MQVWGGAYPWRDSAKVGREMRQPEWPGPPEQPPAGLQGVVEVLGLHEDPSSRSRVFIVHIQLALH